MGSPTKCLFFPSKNDLFEKIWHHPQNVAFFKIRIFQNHTKILTNTLSYIRLMAIGTVGVKIAEAGNMLGFENMILAFEEVFSHGDITALITGIAALMLWIGVQIFAWVLGVFSPNIHAARLHFVEWMKQFYDGSGEPFKPFGTKPKLVEVE